MVFSAFLDTCVLYPSRLRDVLLELACQGAYRAVWSDGVEEELARVLERNYSHKKTIGDDNNTDLRNDRSIYINRLLDQMNLALPDAKVCIKDSPTSFSIESLPDPNDMHIVAGALAGRADVIVTFNLNDFPKTCLPFSLFAQDPDEFLIDLLDLNPNLVKIALRNVANRTGKKGPKLEEQDILIHLGNLSNVKGFATQAHTILYG
ncbi:PIN domain-containing protein [Stomatohabitans albus]|uniref:PIN domain-containing protein n=1 Tax=Stomatohabitans albus TaxID=3110766 RepID=UPI00300D568E